LFQRVGRGLFSHGSLLVRRCSSSGIDGPRDLASRLAVLPSYRHPAEIVRAAYGTPA